MIKDVQLSLATNFEYRKNVEQHLASMTSSGGRTLEDIIRFNEEHASQELPEGNSALTSRRRQLTIHDLSKRAGCPQAVCIPARNAATRPFQGDRGQGIRDTQA